MLVIGHDAYAHAGGATGADATFAGALVHRRGRGRQRGRRAQGGRELGGRLLGHAERTHVARVQDLDGRVMPAGVEAVAQHRDVDESTAIRESKPTRVADRDEHGLTRDLRVEELAPSSAGLQPGAGIVAARHEDAAQDTGAALGADPPEADDARVEPTFRHGTDQQCGRELARTGGQCQGERGRLVIDERGTEQHQANHRANAPGKRKLRSDGAAGTL